nr:metallophosphoesterase family protein [Candidatus Sigynarchaeota archaeon]
MAQRKRNPLAYLVKYIFSAIGILLGLAFLVAAFWLFDNFSEEISGSPVPFVLGLVGVGSAFVIMFFLDRSSTIMNKFARERVNLRWLVIAPAALAFGLVILVAYWLPSHVNYEYLEMTDIDDPATRNFVIYFATFVILLLAGLFIYFSIKNMRPSMRVHKIKFPAFAITNVSAAILIVSIVMILIAPEINELQTRFSEFYPHNDGPWVTWNGDPETSACISWLTSARRETQLFIGDSISNITAEKTGTGNAYLHKVFLAGLSPDTTYYYTIPVVFSQAHASTTFSFRTAPSSAQSFKFTVSGDKQPSNTPGMLYFNGVVVDGIIAQHPDFAVMVGDYASDGGLPSNWHYSLESLARLGGTTPVALAIGNHDYGGNNGVNFGDMFTYPYENLSDGKYYSFNYSNAHVLVIDSVALSGSSYAAQLAWIEADLAAVNGTVDWIFVFLHYTLMSTGGCNYDYSLQAKLVPLFDRYGVDVVIYGHDHFYEHYLYTYGNEGLVHDSTHTWTHHPIDYFCTGGGGANLEAYGYGLLSRAPENVTRTWYNLTAHDYQDITYFKNPWNSSVFYTGNAIYSPDQKLYYQDPAKQIYQEEISHFGYTYGENAYHYMLIEVNGTSCTISAHYPDGALMDGPEQALPQQYVLTST